jgi:hypothetical protein
MPSAKAAATRCVRRAFEVSLKIAGIYLSGPRAEVSVSAREPELQSPPVGMRPTPAKAVFFLLAAPVVIATARRIARREGEVPLDTLLAELRGRAAAPLPRRLARPSWLSGSVERLLPRLPPQDLGPCLRRALIVYELWSRCGLEPRLHVGLKPGTGLRDAHAWITAEGPAGERLAVSSALDFAEAFVF